MRNQEGEVKNEKGEMRKEKGERAGAAIAGRVGKSIRPNRPERAMTSLNRGLAR